MTTTRDRLIIFSGEMVRAILDGRKTQTRRVLKLEGYDGGSVWMNGNGDLEDILKRCPYGVPGYRLYVRETWRAGIEWDDEKPSEIDPLCGGNQIRFEGDGGVYEFTPQGTERLGSMDVGDGWGKIRPSIFLPRWASRITLELTDVRVERVNEISEDDAIAEGSELMHLDDLGQTWKTHKRGFQTLWDSINEKRGYSWESNPFVWAVTFKRIEGET